MQKILHPLFRLINANISVNKQPEWLHWAHRRWPFYTYCTSRHFTDIVSALAIYINDLDMWKNIKKDTTEIVYDNKNLHITELEDTRSVFILFYLLVIKYNDPAVKI